MLSLIPKRLDLLFLRKQESSAMFKVDSRFCGNDSKGFTLIELAIVLVIIGLIVGGVLVGRDLIEGSTIRAQISQIEKINTAVNTFKLKYHSLPGDIHQTLAPQFGLSQMNQSAANQFRYNNGFIDAAASNSLESFYFFLQLQQANLIECTGCNPLGNAWTAATWDPIFTAAKMNNSTLHVYGGPLPASGGFGGEQSYSKNYIEISQLRTATGSCGFLTTGVCAMTPSQAFQIDSKVDDGFPLTGVVVGVRTPHRNTSGDFWNGTRTASQGAAGGLTCASTSSTPAVYNTTITDPRCNLRFDAQF